MPGMAARNSTINMITAATVLFQMRLGHHRHAFGRQVRGLRRVLQRSQKAGAVSSRKEVFRSDTVRLVIGRKLD